MPAVMNRFDLKIIGKGGHGAKPHECVDALGVETHCRTALELLKQPV